MMCMICSFEYKDYCIFPYSQLIFFLINTDKDSLLLESRVKTVQCTHYTEKGKISIRT